MFWSVVTPFLVTCGLLAAATVGATALAPRWGRRRGRVFGLAAGLSLLAFVPSCTVVMKVADQLRFGVFEYADVDAVWHRKIRKWLPRGAKEITVNQHVHGFEAKYKISRADLESWLDQQWELSKGRAANERTEPKKLSASHSLRLMEESFREQGWPSLEEPLEYEGPHAANWAGYVIWFSEADGTAYQRSAYW